MNEKTDMHIFVWRAKTDVHIFGPWKQNVGKEISRFKVRVHRKRMANEISDLQEEYNFLVALLLSQ